MNFRDIVNRDLVTLVNCESEPIHIPGAIQPNGFLLLLSREAFRIDFCSANSSVYCDIGYADLLGRRLGQVFGEGEADKFRNYLQSEQYKAGDPVSLLLGKEALSCTVTPNEQGFLLEAEPFPDGYQGLPDLYQQTRKFVSLLEGTNGLQELCHTIAQETRAITGYDRVMIYRFDKDYNGEVFAESLREDLEPFLRLHYPHTDIPVQARQLYLKNLLRIIPDVGYTPVPVFTIDDTPDKNLDLSASILRSVSPIHIEYLKNMGVGATLTISLIHNRKLWGLITCHHYSPKNLPHYTRVSAQLQGHFLTSQIAVREIGEAFNAGQNIAAALEELLQQTVDLGEDDIGAIVSHKTLLQIAGASGVAIIFKNRIFRSGAVPEEPAVVRLSEWLVQYAGSGSYKTSYLAEAYPDAAETGTEASGILYHALTAGAGNAIIWFRGENKEEVIWAGDPSKAIVKDEKGLSPRKSFEQWKERTSNQSRDWTEAELNAASHFAHSLQKQLNLILLREEEARIRVLNEQLIQANAELENINWISMHDLQEPLRKLQVFASLLIEKEERSSYDDMIAIVHRMSSTAARMQQLLSDIRDYTRVMTGKHPLSRISLDALLGDVIESLADELNDKGAVVRHSPLPHIEGEPFLLRQLFTNLLRNAVKFARPGVPSVIDITAEASMQEKGAGSLPAGRFYRISVTDNGIGFDNDYADAIFGLFKRLHAHSEYNGTGTGLAICRKVMQRHNGFITANGTVGEGASFHLWFPQTP